MRKSIAVWLLITPAFGLVLSLANAVHSEDADYSNVTAETSLQTIRGGHPRLVIRESDLERVRGLIRTNPTARRYSEELRQDAEQLLDAKPVEYIIVGPRLLSQSRRCLDRVYTLGLVYRLTRERRFADRAKKELMAAAAFPDWNPSHFLDTAEMCHAFAIGYDWLFDTCTAEERQTIQTAIIEKALKPALNVYEKNQWWARTIYNWNQVCNGGIGIGALAIADEEPELAGRILSYAVKSIALSMKTFGPDGAFPEGPGYWGYASRYAVYFFAALDSALGADFGLSAIPGFSEAGLFRIYFCGPIGKTFNFADAGEGSGSASQMFWMARQFDKPIYAWHQRESVRSPDPLDLVWFDPRGEGPVKNALPLDRHFKGVDAVFLRSKWEDRNAIFVGFKGGDNRVNHSHLDLGSFVLDALGERWAVDLGPDDYNLPGYFGSQRWTYYRLRTESHNTLVINEKNQSPSAPAPIVGFGSSPERGWAITDMTRAYPDVKGSVQRGMALLNRSHVLVQDEILSSEPVDVVWGMVTQAKVELQGNLALLSIGDARLLAKILEPGDVSFEIISANPPRPQRQQPNARKLAVRIPQAKGDVRIAIVLSPFRESDPTPRFVPELRPLDKWNP